MITFNSAGSLSNQIYCEIRNKILHEKVSGDALASERELMKKFNVSRTTVRQALTRLELAGLITRIHGKGTFVSRQKGYSIDLADEYSFTDHMKQLGIKPVSKLLSLKKTKTMIAGKVDLYWQLKRLRLANKKPELYETTYLPLSFFPELVIEELESNSLYDLIKNKFKIQLMMAHESCTARLINSTEAHYLKLQVGQPCLGLLRSTYDNHNHLIEYTSSAANPYDFSYKTIHVFNK